MLEQIRDKKVLIAGFGVEGQATFEFLQKHGISADIADVSPSVDLKSMDIREKHLRTITGENYLDSASDYDVVFRSPGISPLTPELKLAREKGTEITSQIKLFMEICPCKTIGVTGTKGKGTTSSLIYEILKASGKDVHIGGNIGVPAISLLEKINEDSIVVLELSSFQLMDLEKSPNIAVVLNVTSEHLDYHKNREEYVEAKQSIVQYQNAGNFAVVNTDYETSRLFKDMTKAQIFEISTTHEVEIGCYVNENDEVILKSGDIEEKIASFPELQLRGRHNLENVCAAVAASYLAEAQIDPTRGAVKAFKGLEHRLEFVAKVNEVKYYNDSFATTPETTIAALSAFSEPIVLIAGGSEKGSDYTEMGKVIAQKTKSVFLIGDTAQEIKDKVVSISPDADIREGFTDMKAIVEEAGDIAKPGDVVVLSPGCASFGLFENYKQRGELFKKAVENMQEM